MEQIRHKLIAFEGKAKASRIKAVMKWWTKCISMVIAKTASRNVAFKSDKLMDALFQEGQSAPQRPLILQLETLLSFLNLYATKYYAVQKKVSKTIQFFAFFYFQTWLLQKWQKPSIFVSRFFWRKPGFYYLIGEYFFHFRI